MKLHAALRNAAQERIGTALADAGLEAGCSDWRVGSLSTGMRHRLSLAVACVADAPLVLLDEPTASLDPAAVLQFRQLALRWKSDARTVVFSTHVLADAEALADRVVVMVGGRAMAQHAMSTLRSRVRERSVLRVEMSERNGQADAALAAGASEACWDGQTLVVTAPAELRLGILEGLARAGGVCHFETEPLALERMYMDYMTEFQETTTHGK
jgi:ABC-2 type transport system ATP-binding protein